ncbi:hypothetical protein BB560_000347 [Smittium megazygosporum]|uniref:DNA mismatch repair protein S5 domain-containing protein n=1 Tax=Smittium megazygosporum TaxID=133381 RepID=A0A2T9ZKT1_9FUNG|nr:hypothetical protein BB560_000347 [Smittium megazygosporum]
MENIASKQKPKHIKKLDNSVINRIAAGEIIHRPSNALKELLENSLDANASQIQVLAKDGGMKLLQIIDNGHGINREDLPLLCERFTTSKIQAYEDLEKISTYGFRGEALASISHVAHLSVITKTSDSSCAYKAKYIDGALSAGGSSEDSEPKPCAGNDGTQIIVENLFYNIPYRKQALKKTNEEYSRILDVVGKYAIHNAGVAMSCRKIGPKTIGNDVQTSKESSKPEIIRQIYGRSIADSLEKFEKDLSESVLATRFDGYASNGIFSCKKTTLLLFINNRLVENSSIRSSVEQLYSSTFPKSPKPFVYLSISIRPEYVDVNVHPTKKEVHFLNQDQIIIEVVNAIQQVLMHSNNSQVLTVQNPGRTVLSFIDSDITTDINKESPKKEFSSLSKSMDSKKNDAIYYSPRKVHESKLVRMDSKNFSLKSFIFDAGSGKPSQNGDPYRKRETFGSPLGFRSTNQKKFVEDNNSNSTNSFDTDKDSLSPVTTSKKMIESPTPSHSNLSSFYTKLMGSTANDNASIDMVNTLNSDSGDFISSDDYRKISNMLTKSNTTTETVSVVDSATDPTSLKNKKSEEFEVSEKKRPRVEVKLSSILELRNEWAEIAHNQFTKILHDHIFVGIVDTTRALVQHGTSLYMVDFEQVSEALFYQLALTEFCNFGRIELNPSPKLYDLVLLALGKEIEYDGLIRSKVKDTGYFQNEDFDPIPEEIVSSPDGVALAIVELIVSRREMLLEYYNFSVTEDGLLESIPMMLREYVPNMTKLPLFLLRIGSEVNWEDEKIFFKEFSSELAYFYATEPPTEIQDETLAENGDNTISLKMRIRSQPENTGLESSESDAMKQFYHAVEYRLFPALKAGFNAPASLVASNSVHLIANLPDLYKIFERC